MFILKLLFCFLCFFKFWARPVGRACFEFVCMYLVLLGEYVICVFVCPLYMVFCLGVVLYRFLFCFVFFLMLCLFCFRVRPLGQFCFILCVFVLTFFCCMLWCFIILYWFVYKFDMLWFFNLEWVICVVVCVCFLLVFV